MRTTRILIALAALAITAAPFPVAAQEPAVRRIRLERDTVVDGILCARTGRAYAEFYVAGGRLAECPLARDSRVAGHEFPAGTWVIFRPDGSLRLAWLSRDTRVGPIVCKGEGYRTMATAFHEDGSLETCFLRRTTTIDGVPCRAGTFFGEITGGVAVQFHPNGRLAGCGLARSTTIDGTRYRAWQRISLDEEGVPLRDD